VFELIVLLIWWWHIQNASPDMNETHAIHRDGSLKVYLFVLPGNYLIAGQIQIQEWLSNKLP